MASLATPSASIKSPSSLILPPQKLPPPRTQALGFTSTLHHHTLSHSTHPKTTMAVSEKSSVSSVNSSSSKREVNPIIVIDNYDSFTYNLCQYMESWGVNSRFTEMMSSLLMS
ncbi:UNVERIFIED_CONTAM: Anthranilate synthase beta subunit, chloroplastic [Sesamum angustifolium]|uniref:Anthranilate synthase beta subunit, chloroplastic n=1 Tax=Sesamum angustifolium TaxID=2727405 RepID=A0AAW2M5M7_9LAMI